MNQVMFKEIFGMIFDITEKNMGPRIVSAQTSFIDAIHKNSGFFCTKCQWNLLGLLFRSSVEILNLQRVTEINMEPFLPFAQLFGLKQLLCKMILFSRMYSYGNLFCGRMFAHVRQNPNHDQSLWKPFIERYKKC